MRQQGKPTIVSASLARLTRRLNVGRPLESTPCSWKMFLARSMLRSAVDIKFSFASKNRYVVNTPSVVHYQGGTRPFHYIRPFCRSNLLAPMESADPHLICRTDSWSELAFRLGGSRSDLFAITLCTLRNLSTNPT